MGKKLPEEISEDSNVPVGENASSLINELDKELRRNAPLQGVSTWIDIDESLRKAIIQRALDRSKKAKVARACLPYNHSCGSRSFPGTFAIMDKFLQVCERCSAPDATPMTDMEMLIEVLGSRPGYLRGLGFGLKPPSTKSAAHSRAQEEEMRNLREVIETQNRQIEAQNKFMEGQNKLMEITMKALQ